MKRALSTFMFALLLLSMSAFSFNLQSVKASGTIYIRADGSIDPADVPISTLDSSIYTFTEDINGSIVVERNHIIIDGNGFTLQGLGGGYGIDLSERENVTVQNTLIKNFDYGVWLSFSGINTVEGNNITANKIAGISLSGGEGNKVTGNNVMNNSYYGISLEDSSGNTVSGNNAMNNGDGIYLWGGSGNTLRSNIMADNTRNFGVNVERAFLLDLFNYVDMSNTVDGKPVYYLLNGQDITVPPDAGYVALINCTRITVQNVNLTKNSEGILLVYTTNTTIAQNNIANNKHGILLYFYSGNNTISGNNIANNDDGILLYLYYSNNNTVSGNNITNNGIGIWLYDSSGNTISSNTVANNDNGIWSYYYSSSNTVSGNNATNNGHGIELSHSSNDNIILGNNVMNNNVGIWLDDTSHGNTFAHNNFMENIDQAHSSDSTNSWDDGYPSGGNYWSDYAYQDNRRGPHQNEAGSDGIGDTPYVIGANNTDRYPLLARITAFDAGTWNGTTCNIEFASNSTVSNLQIDVAKRMLNFSVTGPESTHGFCRVIVPNTIVQDLWHGSYTVLLNSGPWPFMNWTDATNTYLYINYTHSEHEITIVPENLPVMTLALFAVFSTLAVALSRRRLRKSLL